VSHVRLIGRGRAVPKFQTTARGQTINPGRQLNREAHHHICERGGDGHAQWSAYVARAAAGRTGTQVRRARELRICRDIANAIGWLRCGATVVQDRRIVIHTLHRRVEIKDTIIECTGIRPTSDTGSVNCFV
jgi:hypothetical protein